MSQMPGRILINMAACKQCHEVLLSLRSHDFRQCECENQTHVDGGSNALKRGALDPTKLEELSIVILNGKLYKVSEWKKTWDVDSG